jgi:hypothetical protein
MVEPGVSIAARSSAVSEPKALLFSMALSIVGLTAALVSRVSSLRKIPA